jgi:hypothetical protein
MTARQIAKPQPPNTNADKLSYLITNGVEHAANLAIDSLSQDDAQTDGRHGVESRNPCSFTVEKDSAQQFRRESGIPWPIQRYLVFLLDLVARVGKPLREIAIICEKKQTFGLCVQPPDVEQPGEFCRQQIENSVVHVRISPRRDESGGLVQYNGQRRGNMNEFAIHLDVVARVRLCAKVSAGFTVDGDPTCRDQFVAMPARSDTRSG